MEANNPRKIKLLKLYEMLRQRTDEDRPLSTNHLCSMLGAEGITCDRRTLSEDIDTLNANGFEVLHRRTRYAMLFYLVDRRFYFAEVKTLIDAIPAASFITKQITKELTDKVASLAGSRKAAVLKENLVTFNTRKHTCSLLAGWMCCNAILPYKKSLWVLFYLFFLCVYCILLHVADSY